MTDFVITVQDGTGTVYERAEHKNVDSQFIKLIASTLCRRWGADTTVSKLGRNGAEKPIYTLEPSDLYREIKAEKRADRELELIAG